MIQLDLGGKYECRKMPAVIFQNACAKGKGITENDLRSPDEIFKWSEMLFLQECQNMEYPTNQEQTSDSNSWFQSHI